MKKLYYILLLVSFYSFGQCPNNVVFTSQAEIDAFPINYPNCNSFDESVGWLEISGNDVVDLTPLAGLTQVFQIFIHDNLLLTDLDGLQNITSTSEDYGPFVIIQDNQVLNDISALSNLVVTGNEGNGGIGIRRNPALLSLNGLQGFSALVGFVDIQDNDALTSLFGLNNILGADDFNVIGNDSLINLVGIDSFISGGMLIENNISFQSLTGLNSSFSSGIQLVENPNIENLDGLEVVASLFGLSLVNNNSLSDISAIENIQLGSGSDATLVITDNPNLSVCAYSSVCNTIVYCEPLFCDIQFENNAPGCNNIADLAVACGILPTNDDCEDAITISLNSSIDAYNVGATQSTHIPSCNDSANRVDVWFSFTTSNEGIFDIAVSDGTYNLQVWEGDCTNLTPVPNTCGVNELLDANLAFNTTYYLQVWSDDLVRAAGVFSVDIVNTTLSLNDEIFDNFSIFPNPTNTLLRYTGNDIVDKVTIYNAIGQEMLTLKPKATSGLIDLSNFSSALYFVQVRIGTTIKTFKILKE